jgi:hypothetical protein
VLITLAGNLSFSLSLPVVVVLDVILAVLALLIQNRTHRAFSLKKERGYPEFPVGGRGQFGWHIVIKYSTSYLAPVVAGFGVGGRLP